MDYLLIIAIIVVIALVAVLIIQQNKVKAVINDVEKDRKALAEKEKILLKEAKIKAIEELQDDREKLNEEERERRQEIARIETKLAKREDVLEDKIQEYNDAMEADGKEANKITYTDYIGIMMSSITTIINAITYVLIAFVAISLVVSSIMIGVITLISVQERTKEIGILRSIGASKRNVSGMFNAETVIIGFTSGVLGVGVTYGLCVVVNLILFELTEIANLKAILPPEIAVALVLVSILLTLFAGIIPSRSAAKKDPVVALRTE